MSNSQKGLKFQSKNKKSKEDKSSSAESGEVLLKLPGGFKYQLPGKRQRIVVGTIVLGLNLLLIIAVIAYFYIPDFQSFIYNVGRK